MDNLVFVRADSFAPKVGESGVILENAHEATAGEIRRLTKHFTLNHRVVPNSGGGHETWVAPPYLFVIPGGAMIASNGNPENLYPVDSFWTQSVALPAGSVIIYERGMKPNLGDKESDYFLVERSPEDSDSDLISRALGQMGYTEVKGSDRFSAPGYENFDKAVMKFAAEHGMRSGPHEFSWSDYAEKTDVFLAQGRNDFALGQLLGIYGNQGHPGEAERMPEELKTELAERVFSLPPDVTDEVLEGLVKKITRILDREDIADNEKALLLRRVPLQIWQHVYAEMLKNIGGFEGFRDAAEVAEAFRHIYANPYQRLTGQMIDLGIDPETSKVG